MSAPTSAADDLELDPSPTPGPDADVGPPAPGPAGDTDRSGDADARLARVEEIVSRRDTWTVIVLGIAFFLVIASIVAIGLSQRDEGSSAPAVAGQTITAELTEYAIDLSADEVTPGSTITITNTGRIEHTLGVRDTDIISPVIQPGETATLPLTGLGEGDYELYCDVPGHVESGMTTSLTISADADAAAPDAPAADAGGGTGMSPGDHSMMDPAQAAAMDEAMMASILEFPAETAGRGNQPLTPTILADGTKHFELTASIVDWEIAPGEVVQAWAYNGQVPGPRIDLDLGDRVEITLTNELPIGTDIHLHGVDLGNDQDGVAPITQDLVEPGATFTYRFTAEAPAIGMYHAHAHAQEAVPNGLFATIYIGDVAPPAGRTVSGFEIPADLTVAADVPMVVNDAGVIGLSLNGKSFPATEPLVVDEGDWLTVTYFNEGLQVHPMHLHGFEQIVYAKDGHPLDEPYAADTVLVAPGERYSVLINADRAGTWVWHCHILNHVESAEGMFGMVTALVVQ